MIHFSFKQEIQGKSGAGNMEFHHISVMLEETVKGLVTNTKGTYVDCTLGGAGHSRRIAELLEPEGRLIGIDQDEAAIAAATERLRDAACQVNIVHSNFRNLEAILAEENAPLVDGVVFDLGVSSHQIDTAERGFSYMQDAPLDMRMDRRESRTAADLVNEADEGELTRILREYGEERFARNIAKNIVQARSRKKIETTGELAAIIKASIPMKMQLSGGHPAKRTFQALRIELNGELSALSGSLERMVDLLSDGGRLCVITFHSLEDRIVKNVFRTCENPCVCPPEFPVCKCGRVSKGKVLTRKAILPSEEEMKINSRSKSAKLRIFERRKLLGQR